MGEGKACKYLAEEILILALMAIGMHYLMTVVFNPHSPYISIRPREWASLIAIFFYSFANSAHEMFCINMVVLLLLGFLLEQKLQEEGVFFAAATFGAFVGGLAILLFEQSSHGYYSHYYAGFSNAVYGVVGLYIWLKNSYFRRFLFILLIVVANILVSQKADITILGHLGGLAGGILMAESHEEESDAKKSAEE